MLQNLFFFYREEAEYSDQLALLNGTLTDTTAAEHQTKKKKKNGEMNEWQAH